MQLWAWYNSIVILNLGIVLWSHIYKQRHIKKIDVYFHSYRYWEVYRINRKLEEQTWIMGGNQGSCRKSWSRRWDSHISVWPGMTDPPMDTTSRNQFLVCFISTSPTRVHQTLKQGSLLSQVRWLLGWEDGELAPFTSVEERHPGHHQSRGLLWLPFAASLKKRKKHQLLLIFMYLSLSHFSTYTFLKKKWKIGIVQKNKLL